MQRRKTAACPNCCPNGGAYFDASWDYTEAGAAVPIWECANCFHKLPRRTPKPHRERQTPAQNRMVAALRRRIEERHCNGRPETHEFKKFEATLCEHTGYVYVISEYGMIGDEGTMASLLCRDYRHIVIGRSGGLTLLNPKDRSTKPRGLFDVTNELVQ
jgi:hypothetical protein